MHRRSRSNRTKDINSYYGDCASLVYSFIPNRRGSPFVNFRPICHYPRSLFHNPLILIFGRIATTPVYYINPVNLMHIFGISSRKIRKFDSESESANGSLSCRFSARVIPRPLLPPVEKNIIEMVLESLFTYIFPKCC